jgi:adenylate cyclase
MFARLPQALVVFSLLGLLLLLRVWDPAPIAHLRLVIFDAYQQLNPRTFDPNGPVRIIDIDEASLKRHGQWPWPRSLLAKIVNRAHNAGAAAIGFDILLAEPDRLSPEEIVKAMPSTPQTKALTDGIKNLPGNDALLAGALAGTRAVLAIVLSNDQSQARLAAKSGFASAGDDPKLFVHGFSGAIFNRPVLNKAAKGLGAVNWVPDRDQIIRRVPVIAQADGKLYPGLAAEMLRVAQGASTMIVRSSGASASQSFGAKTGIIAVRIGRFTVPTDARGQLLIRFTKSQKPRFIPAWRLLEDKPADFDLKGRIVLIGTSAAGLLDLRATPLGRSVPGIEVHAQAMEQIIAGDFLYRPDYAKGMELVYLFVIGLILGLLMLRFGAKVSGTAAVSAIVLVCALSWFAYNQWHLLLDPLYPVLAIAALYLAGTVFAYLHTEREKREIRKAFSRYLAPALVEQLAAHPDRLKLGGETREMSLLFCDIRDFTTLAEGLNAAELLELMNRYLSPMTEVILAHKGTVDKYMGDCIMAFWNAPIDDVQHAENACQTSRAMIGALEELNRELGEEAAAQNKSARRISIGIGLNTGPCHVGNMGSALRFDYSVIGDNVNVASRLEGQTKQYHVPIIMGEDTASVIDERDRLELDLIKVKGKDAPERIYALRCAGIFPPQSAMTPLHEAHARVLAAYRGGQWIKAEKLIKQAKTLGGAGLAAYYDMLKARIAAFKKTPPPADWCGVYAADEK